MLAEFQAAEEQTLALNLQGFKETYEPTFIELNYQQMIPFLGNYYLCLQRYMKKPSIVRYDELARLRRYAISPDITNPHYNRYQSQLALACNMLRLGRRQEGLGILSEIESRLTMWGNPNRSRCYLLWIALLKAVVGDKQGAFQLAMQIASHGSNPELDHIILSFFRSLRHSYTEITL
ncbi:MAG TPA: hypothetical protein VH186_13780 [Chloroflexia bacterium]|nr:hypothetical protein [Chloroflexia bacterium]